MREIKFRVWDKKENIMIHGANWLTIPDSSTTRWEVMQFTGLFDLHGKEIYEGDIVITYENPSKYQPRDFTLTEELEQHKIIVTWNKESAGFGLGLYGDFEVIGNIYENKDLL